MIFRVAFDNPIWQTVPDLNELQPLCLLGTAWASMVGWQVGGTIGGSALHDSFVFLLRLFYNLGVFYEQYRLHAFPVSSSKLS